MIAPRAIKKLDETVVNRIAAGEVVQRPSAAIKEMLENSLDAGASSISVTVKGGGLQLLMIQDNGSGIKKEDLGIVCERFTTSKLSTFEDLKTISTFGFRGEALASITHVSHLTITTRTADAPCAYKAKYTDGQLVPIKAGGKSDPQPCAGTVGTTIAVEDLFYNMNTRRTAFKNLNEQYQRVLDVVTKYSIHYSVFTTEKKKASASLETSTEKNDVSKCSSKGVSFTCKRHGQSLADLHTTGSSVTDTIRLAYGVEVARELLDLEFSENASEDQDKSYLDPVSSQQLPSDFERCEFSVRGKISNANYSSKRGMFIIFINNRLVESASVKRVVESLYVDLLPKHSHPFAYLSIEMPLSHVDVNVHPTKKEVHFLHETELLERLHKEITKLLSGASNSRTFYAKPLLPQNGESVGLSDIFPTKPSRPEDSHAAAVGRGTMEISMESSSQSTSRSRIVESNQVEESPQASIDSTTARRPKPPAQKQTSLIDAATVQDTKISSSKTRSSIDAKRLVRVDSSVVKINQVFGSASSAWPQSSEMQLESVGGKKRRIAEAQVHQEHEQEREQAEEDSSGETDSSNNVHDSGMGNADDGNGFPFMLCGECKNPSSLETFQNKGNQTNASKSSLSLCPCCGVEKYYPQVEAVKELTRAVSSSTTTPSNPLSLTFKFTETPINYDSIHGLLAEINNGYNATLQKAISQHVVVGVVSQRWSAVQCGTRLLLLDHCRLSEHLFYQLSIRRFAVMPTIPLVNHVPVYSYILAALDQPEADWKLEDGSKLEIAGRATKLLREKAGLLKEYFSIGIEESSSANDEEDASNAVMLTALPELIPSYRPDPNQLPMFLLRLATDTDWKEEQGCFRTIACNVAMYYAHQASDEAEMTSQYNVSDVVKTTLVNILLPAIRSQLKLPSECATDGTVVQIAALEQLYKVFERC